MKVLLFLLVKCCLGAAIAQDAWTGDYILNTADDSYDIISVTLDEDCYRVKWGTGAMDVQTEWKEEPEVYCESDMEEGVEIWIMMDGEEEYELRPTNWNGHLVDAFEVVGMEPATIFQRVYE